MDAAAHTLFTWQMHERAGLHRIGGAQTVVRGADVELQWCGLQFACRVVHVIDEPDHRGFAYGTLPGHPEVGEERFEVSRDPNSDEVTATITVFSRPAGMLLRIAGPAGRHWCSAG